MKREHLAPIAKALLAAQNVRGVHPGDLASALELGKPIHLTDGEVLCSEGDVPSEMFLLVEGQIRVTRLDKSGASHELASLQAPTMIGHMGLVDGSPRCATCSAQEEALVLAIDLEACRLHMADPSLEAAALRRFLLASLSRQLADTNSRIRRLLNTGELKTGFETEEKPQGPIERELTLADVSRLAATLEGWTQPAT